MLGTIVNVGAIVTGSLIGGLFRKIINEKLSGRLMSVMSLAMGCLIGTLLKLDERLGHMTKQKDESGSLSQGIVTGCLIFCVGTLSILGPVQSALYGDHTYLFTNASLDFVTAMVLGTTYGVGMALAGIILLLWKLLFHF